MGNRRPHPPPVHTPANQSADDLIGVEPPIPAWISALVLLAILLLGAGAIISLAKPAMLASPSDSINGAVHIYAGYTAARDGALTIMLTVLLSLRARKALGQLLSLIGLIQLLDATIDLFEQRWTIAPLALVLGLLFLTAATRLRGSPFWRRAAWK